ncbi:helix-turn-helix domain-containing protein [Yinghuangia aomiensis]
MRQIVLTALRRNVLHSSRGCQDPHPRPILDAAERLFAERGVAAVSLREIGAAAGQRNNWPCSTTSAPATRWSGRSTKTASPRSTGAASPSWRRCPRTAAPTWPASSTYLAHLPRRCATAPTTGTTPASSTASPSKARC